MFYVTTLSHEIELLPKHFGSRLKQTLKRLIKEETEGLAISHYGYIICVLDVPEDKMIGGIIEYDTSSVVYTCEYQALLFRPFINEVLDAVVTQVNALGFFAFVGPLRVFVSKHSMPEDISGTLDNGGGYDGERDSWISADKEVEIRAGCGVRLKIKGATVEEGNINAIGSIKDDFLGLIDNGVIGEMGE